MALSSLELEDSAQSLRNAWSRLRPALRESQELDTKMIKVFCDKLRNAKVELGALMREDVLAYPDSTVPREILRIANDALECLEQRPRTGTIRSIERHVLKLNELYGEVVK